MPASVRTDPSVPRTPVPAVRDPFLRDLVGTSGRMQRMLRLMGKVAPTDATVLLRGESGTGKELVARHLHLASRRAGGPFVPVNMAAIPENLIESELFGYVRGAFSGAAADRIGLVESANQGTLFLDEIGDMPLPTQAKMLRMLESNEVRRLGENALRPVDVRVVAATHRDLPAEIAAGRFREDLYYRLNVVQLELPPLRERTGDVRVLANYFLERYGRRDGGPARRLSSEALALLERYPWPGNVRELEHAIEHAIAVGDGGVIEPADLPQAVRSPLQLGAGGPKEAPRVPMARPREEWSLAEVERDHIEVALARHGGNASAAARQLGISRTTLWRKMRHYGLRRENA